MEIKQFNEISTQQKKELYNFIKGKDLTYNKTYIEMTRIYESDTFNEGNNVFIIFDKDVIKGSAAVITKEISMRSEAFITDTYICNDNIEKILGLIINKIVNYCNNYGAKSIKIGIRQSEIYLIPYIEDIEFNHIYDAVIMKYGGERNKVFKQSKDIELKSLSILNSHEYMNIQNEAFENSPNGGTIDEMEVKDYIVKYANNKDLIGICYIENKPCGIYELSMDGNIGWINTLGIMTKYQKKGIGQKLIVKCFQKLWEKDSDVIKLLVMTSNEIAVKMYKENEFKEERIFSYWFEKNNYNK